MAADRRARPLFADLLRAVGAVEGIRRVRYTSPHPKDLRPETIAAMADDAGGVRAPAPARCSRAATAILAAMHRGYTAERYLERLAAARAAIADLAVTTDIIVGLPRRDRRRLRAHARGRGRGRVRQRLHVHLLAPPGHRGGRARRTDFVDPAVVVRAVRAPARRRRARSGSGQHEARVGRVEEVLVEGPRKRDPTVAQRPHPPEQAGALRRRPSRCAPAPTPPSESRGAGPHYLRGELRRGHGAGARTAPASRSPLA